MLKLLKTTKTHHEQMKLMEMLGLLALKHGALNKTFHVLECFYKFKGVATLHLINGENTKIFYNNMFSI